ncbi:uncharacterized protein [Diadema antillarum]|uniref:uncharacterized protein n=1 Tax=Diadema antillarum TaxID=105358 RepID=UPI003A83BC5D
MEIHAVFLVALYLLILIVGIPGNLLIILITANRSVKKSVHVFIIALAMADLVACCLAPFGIHYWLFEKVYYSVVMCKLYISIVFFGTFSTMFLTVAIAFDRYFAVCHPLKAIMSPQRACVVCVACFVGALFCVPASTAFGIRRLELEVSVCTLTAKPWLLEVVGALITLAFILAAAMIIVLYVHMCVMVRRQARFHVRVAPAPVRSSLEARPSNNQRASTVATVSFQVSRRSLQRSLSQPADDISQTAEVQTSEQADAAAPSIALRLSPTQLAPPSGTTTEADKPKPNAPQEIAPAVDSRQPYNQLHNNAAPIVLAMANKTTKMLILSTMVFIVSWLPNVVIKALPTSLYQAVNGHHPAVIAVVRIFEYLFLVNHAANPFVYSLVNERFRRLCAQYLQNLRRRFLSY